MSKTVSPTGRLTPDEPNLQNISMATPDSRRVIAAIRRALAEQLGAGPASVTS
jgi:DNA polymerase I-like protein with 3'-5' exonuclease and polymerase domains